ncbi:hypothetical protein ONR07_24545, partial [Salmonella enterica subsp. enterica serovar Anatum]|nr:hypothetical protein [Salmonella enterica subsp. enterica serovar Anatum]
MRKGRGRSGFPPLTCIITGMAAALLIGSLQFFLSWHKRDVKYNTLLSDVQHYLA